MGPGVVWAALDFRHSARWAQELQICTAKVEDLPLLEIQGSGLLLSIRGLGPYVPAEWLCAQELRLFRFPVCCLPIILPKKDKLVLGAEAA